MEDIILERVKEGSNCTSKRGKTLIKTDSVDKATIHRYTHAISHLMGANVWILTTLSNIM